MVVGAFPAAKLGALLLKQISKPIANAIKEQAKTTPVFRKYVCMPPAQFYNWCEVQAKMWIMNLGKPVNIPVLNEAMAIELGANLLGEGIIFIIAAGILISEYNRSSRKEAAKEAAKEAEMQRLQNTLIELYMQTEQQATQIREMNRFITELDSRVMKKPWVGKEEGPPPPPPPPIMPLVPILDSNEPKSPPSSSSSFSSTTTTEEQNEEQQQLENVARPQSVVLSAVRSIEQEFWAGPEESPKRKKGLLVEALNYLYRDVYKLPALSI